MGVGVGVKGVGNQIDKRHFQFSQSDLFVTLPHYIFLNVFMNSIEVFCFLL